MKSIRLFIKGTKKAAQRSAHPAGSTHCETACANQTRVVKWYTEKGNIVRGGRGYMQGTLLFYGGCPSGSLGGARKRRRKR